MSHNALRSLHDVRIPDGTLLLALTGWMDGGMVSTGTLRQMMEGRSVRTVAHIDADPFYIYNFPGDMETSAFFRPHVKYDNGMVEDLEMPTNEFFVDERAGLAFFSGKEPNLHWQDFAECIFEMSRRLAVRQIVFVGSFGGSVPHTREPRLFGSVSEIRLMPILREHGIQPTNYQGPASFATLLLRQSVVHHLEMISIAAEIPGYLEGVNPMSIEALSRRLGSILGVPVNLDRLRGVSNTWEIEVSEAVEKDEKLAASVRKMEEEYDNELIRQAEH